MTTMERRREERELAQRLAAAAAMQPVRHADDLFIDGEYRPAAGRQRTPLIDPATGQTWGSAPTAADADVDAAVGAASRALRGWRERAPSDRARLMLAMADAIERRAETLATTSTLENGSPLAETAGVAANAVGILRYFASLAPELERPDVRVSPADPGLETSVHRDPIGVCALIAPWNFPINLVLIKLAPALLAGCTVIIKPAPSTSVSIRAVVDAAAEIGVPAGVVNVITGGATVGDRLLHHPGCPRNTGQTCFVSARMVATPELYDDVVELTAETVAAATISDPFDTATVFGPLAIAAQRDIVRDCNRSGLSEGARAATGGDISPPFDQGWWVTPTVFADVEPSMRIAREEIFGPMLSILRAEDIDDAVAIANATEYGLGGAVFGSDESRTFDVARRIDTGSIGLGFFASNPAAPFGGRHDSGLGVEYGPEGLAEYLSPQSVQRRRR